MFLVCGRHRLQLMRVSLDGHDNTKYFGVARGGFQPDGDYPNSSLLAQAANSAAILPGPELPNQESAHRAHAQRDTRGNSVGVRTLRRPSNQRMKLSARDHSLFCVRLGRRSFL